MGQFCSCDGWGNPSDFQQTSDVKPERRPIKTKHITIDPYASDDMEGATASDTDDYCSSTSQYLDASDQHRDSSAPPVDHSDEITQKAITGFKEAVINGNDSLVMYFVEEYPDLGLLKLEFENGDNCLHVAVRNSSYNLIYYLLTHGISVNYNTKFPSNIHLSASL